MDVVLSLFSKRFVRGFSFEDSVWSVKVVEVLPFIESLLEVDIALVAEQLVELLLI